ncbi:MAG: hypothetical protein AAGA48_32760 [Myxococcota bacterium]
MWRIGVLAVALAGCEDGFPTDPLGPLTECEQFFETVQQANCEGDLGTKLSCASLECSEISLIFNIECVGDEATCCAYRDCWGSYEACMSTCGSDKDFEQCLIGLQGCTAKSLVP